MRLVRQRAIVPVTVDATYDRLSDFAAYPDLAPSVLRVDVFNDLIENGHRRSCQSAWEVTFRNGVLSWEETDEFDRDHRTVSFEQVDGDLEVLRGSWSVREAASGGSEVHFEAEFDLGLPGLEDFLEPVAQRALEDNVRELMTRLFEGAKIDDGEEVSDGTHAGS